MSKFVAVSVGCPNCVFHFDSVEEFEEKAEEYKKHFVEEWSIEVLESDAPVCYQNEISQNNLEFWLDNEDLAAENPIAVEFLIDLGGDWQDNIENHLEDVMVYMGQIAEYAKELAEDSTPKPDRGLYWEYIDWERVANEGECSGNYVEIQPREWVVNANSF